MGIWPEAGADQGASVAAAFQLLGSYWRLHPLAKRATPRVQEDTECPYSLNDAMGGMLSAELGGRRAVF